MYWEVLPLPLWKLYKYLRRSRHNRSLRPLLWRHSLTVTPSGMGSRSLCRCLCLPWRSLATASPLLTAWHCARTTIDKARCWSSIALSRRSIGISETRISAHALRSWKRRKPTPRPPLLGWTACRNPSRLLCRSSWLKNPPWRDCKSRCYVDTRRKVSSAMKAGSFLAATPISLKTCSRALQGFRSCGMAHLSPVPVLPRAKAHHVVVAA